MHPSLLASVLLLLAPLGAAQVCCDGTASPGVCVNSLCPKSYRCENGFCCAGCIDTCYDCYLYTAQCNNPLYANCMSCCQFTCGKCAP
uniref:ShKT domain-containing protein n=1 Tax=Steinernema glaseri TaxID=37863 RepID=A0A1I8AUF1_9BILA